MRPFVGLNGVYEHHGIDCGDGTVIHYRKTGTATISRTSLAAFAAGNPVFVKQQPMSYIPEVVIQRAESRLGEQQYNLLRNNCEHFATWCKTGRNESEQLIQFGLDPERLGLSAARKLIEEAALQGGDTRMAAVYLEQALKNIAIAQSQLQPQYDQVQAEMHTWQRVAQLALKRGREDLARAALERKVGYQKKATDLKTQLDKLTEMKQALNRNSVLLEQRELLQS
jgi:hypothetical protein